MRDVLHVFANALLREALGCSIVYDDVASDAARNLVVDVVVDPVLMLSPADLDLR